LFDKVLLAMEQLMERSRPSPKFLFLTCQIGAEPALKAELARRWPDFRFAYSRPGFLTFKLPSGLRLRADFDLESVFARAYGFSLGKVTAHDVDELAEAVWEMYGKRTARRLHVWEQDRTLSTEADFRPEIGSEVINAREAILRKCPNPEVLGEDSAAPPIAAKPGDFVLDCVIVRPGEWWVGYHQARSVPSRWPGGMIGIEMPSEVISRAWLKLEEGLRWSEFSIRAGARCADIGSAPGGAAQALLTRGVKVLGIDPAEMAPAVTANPNFTHIRRRVSQVGRREFRKIRWITADMNVAPDYTLDAVEAIVTHPEVNVRGLLLTLKLFEWKLADQIPEYLERVRQWGYNEVRARQLRYNRQECCLAALARPFVRKNLKRRR
jgi:23S rRNA (cytidine2498-2'-O)-methyltransferase